MQSMLSAKFLVVPNVRTLRLDAFYTSDALQKLFTLVAGKKGSRYIEGEGAIEPTTGFFQARMSSLNYTGCPCCYGNPRRKAGHALFFSFARRPEEAETKRGAQECIGCRPLNYGISESFSPACDNDECSECAALERDIFSRIAVGSSTLKLLENRSRDDHYSHFSPIACHIETIPNER
ncbi:hypothetical protein ALC60_00620 [Trachymyrmex zeteki]|uniref:Uncharacterized protein n=1 Tax=Mycetomoellerius zeteki TaxID=64791 RepID=A0A151XIH9_9HYME|nr:hypothetical protein ALC60_00620 [Trachymyrmex zeteki]